MKIAEALSDFHLAVRPPFQIAGHYLRSNIDLKELHEMTFSKNTIEMWFSDGRLDTWRWSKNPDHLDFQRRNIWILVSSGYDAGDTDDTDDTKVSENSEELVAV